MCFVDLCKAYGSVNHEALWRVLRLSYRIPAKLVSIIRAFHQESTALVCAYGKPSAEFCVTCGVRQGCVLAPSLFSLYFDAVIHRAIFEHEQLCRGVKMTYLPVTELVGNRKKMHSGVVISDLDYADDLVLVSSSWDDMKCMLLSL